MPTAPEILWPPCPVPPRLSVGEAHGWCAALDRVGGELADLLGSLSDDERTRAQRLHFPVNRRRYAVARSLLREILACYLGVRPVDLRFAYGPNGKPELREPGAGRDLQFNLSHSGALALFALAWRRPVGVDLEEIRPIENIDTIAARYFVPAEAELLQQIEPGRRCETFYQLWTQHEARVKARGTHLDDTLPASSDSRRPWAGSGQPFAEQAWHVILLQPAVGYAAAVAFAEGDPRLHVYEWVPKTAP
ncbi:MAG: 4'-phosphopantetheinyl transferase superfamily protein [Opitutae bacterium]|nr:4'-phosphopantetheinyl transferase superfamily protein [Opitutae bacterium]